jgi:hypothetical protein
MKASTQLSFGVLMLVALAVATGSVSIGFPAQVVQDQYVWEQQDISLNQVLHAVWGSSSTNVFAVGNDGTIVRCDGKACRPQVSGTFENLYAVWGSSATDVYAAGSRGTIVHFDGGHWQSVASNIVNGCDFRAIWGSSPSDVYVAGAEGAMTAIEGGRVMPSAGVIFHYDGARWLQQQTMPTITTVTAVWGSSRQDVYAGIAGGSILHFDGSTWSLVAQVPVEMWGRQDVQALWGTSPKDLYVARTQTYESTPQGEDSPGTWITFSVLLYYDGKTWLPEPKGMEGTPSVGPVWVNSPEDVYAVGPGGALIHFDGSDWEALANLPPVSIHRIWVAPTGEVVAIGAPGAILWGRPRG